MASTFDGLTKGTPLIILCVFLFFFLSLRLVRKQLNITSLRLCLPKSNNVSSQTTFPKNKHIIGVIADLSKGTTAEACLSGKMLEYQRVCMWMMKRTERRRDALRIWTRSLVHYPKQGRYKEGNTENTEIHHSEVFVNTFANYSLFLFRFETTCDFLVPSKNDLILRRRDSNPASSRSPHPVTQPSNLTWNYRMNPVFKGKVHNQRSSRTPPTVNKEHLFKD